MSPLKTSTYVALDEGNYVLKLIALEDAEPGQFGNRMRWTFNCWHAETGEQVVDEQSGAPFEWWQTTSESIAERSTARPWVEALLGRKIQPGDDPGAISEEIIGKSMEAYVAPNERDYTTILRAKPRVAKAAAGRRAAAPPPAEDDADGVDPF